MNASTHTRMNSGTRTATIIAAIAAAKVSPSSPINPAPETRRGWTNVTRSRARSACARVHQPLKGVAATSLEGVDQFPIRV